MSGPMVRHDGAAFVYRALLFTLTTTACVGSASQQPGSEPTSTPSASAPSDAPTADGEPVVIGQTYTLSSSVLGSERRLSIRVPSRYGESPEQRYPVVYVIDGGPEQDFPHLAGLAQSREVNLTFAPFILVGVETVNRRAQITPTTSNPEEYKKWLGTAPGGAATFRRFLRDEVQPWVQSRYRTNGQQVVIGESLAGLFIIETLFEDPTLFDDYVAVSPSMWWEAMEYGREAERYLQRLSAGRRRLYLTMANEGYRMQDGLNLLVAALKAHAPDGLSWVYVDRSAQETHASVYHVAALDAFRLLFPEPTRIYRANPLLSGRPATPRTPVHESRLARDCTVTNAQRTTPKDTRDAPADFAYACVLHDYGALPTAGNWVR